MLGYVLKERRLVREAFIARVAFEGFVRLVTAGMALKVAELRESFVATGMTAFVWLVTRMRTDVLLKVRQLRKLALANLTTVWLDPQVYTCVLRQVRAVGERFAALRTLVRLSFAHVQLCVQLEVCF